jgi:DNA-binding NtrC family response regulator
MQPSRVNVAQRQADTPLVRRGGDSILILQGDQARRTQLEHLLRRRCYGPVTAESVEGALAALRDERVAGAIIDPDLQDDAGRDVIVRVPPGTPVIMLSDSCRAAELARVRPRTRLAATPCSMTWVIDTLEDMLTRARDAHVA